MSEAVYLVLAVSLVVSYLLLIGGGGSRRDRSHTQEIETVLRHGERDIDTIYERGKSRIDEEIRRA